MTTAPKIIRAATGRSLRMLGNQMLLKLTGEDTNNQFTIVEASNAPGSGIALHVHTREDETFLVAEGTVEFVIGQEHYTLGAGDMAFGPRNLPHSYQVVGDTPARMITQLSPSGLENMFRELSELPAGPPNRAEVATICARHGITFV